MKRRMRNAHTVLLHRMIRRRDHGGKVDAQTFRDLQFGRAVVITASELAGALVEAGAPVNAEQLTRQHNQSPWWRLLPNGSYEPVP
jgi:hypothetical protein